MNTLKMASRQIRLHFVLCPHPLQPLLPFFFRAAPGEVLPACHHIYSKLPTESFTDKLATHSKQASLS